MSKFRILSIDGGGLKGVFPAAFLATIEQNLPNPIHRYFDLITGTSTGGIIALGLGFGLTATQLVQFYVDQGPKIFPPRRRKAWLKANELFKPRYDGKALRSALTAVFGSTKLGEIPARLLIPTLNAASGHIHIYKTPYHTRLEMDHKVSVVDVALATSAAPTYLPVHLSPEGVPFLDGGLWANNPTGMAVVDAISMLDATRNNIEVLSLGCTRVPQNFAKLRGGKAAWASEALNAAMSGQSFASMGTAFQLIGHEHVVRINPETEPKRYELDAIDHVEELKGLGYAEARNAIPRLRPRFFSEVAQPYEPCHGSSVPQTKAIAQESPQFINQQRTPTKSLDIPASI